MSFEKRLFKLVPAYLLRQQYFAESTYDLDYDLATALPGSADYLGETVTPQEIEDDLRESWLNANRCTNDAQNPERWFDDQIFLVMDGWNSGPTTRFKAFTDFMTTVCLIMQSVRRLGESTSDMRERWHAQNVRNNYITKNLGTYPRPKTSHELFMTVADILRNVGFLPNENGESESRMQVAVHPSKMLEWDVWTHPAKTQM
jgi:hypothetical protein